MNRRKDAAPWYHWEHHTETESFPEQQQLLGSLLHSSVVGFAVVDDQLRYQALNEKLAAMNGIPRKAHLGRAVREVLGEAGSQVEPIFRQVLATGRPILDQELTAHLPARTELAHWIGSAIPLKSADGEVRHVGAIVAEITSYKRLEQQVYALVGRLARARDYLARRGEERVKKGEPAEVLAQSIDLLDECLQETRNICQLLSPPEGTLAAAGGPARIPLAAAIGNGGAPGYRAMPTAQSETGRLTARETEVVQLLARSKSNKEIAVMLNLSVKTVETYRARIMLKLNLHSIAEIVVYAFRHKMVQV